MCVFCCVFLSMSGGELVSNSGVSSHLHNERRLSNARRLQLSHSTAAVVAVAAAAAAFIIIAQHANLANGEGLSAVFGTFDGVRSIGKYK